MRIAALSPHLVGKRLARTIRDAEGKVLLAAGVALTPGYIKSLQQRGYRWVYVENELAPDITVTEAVNEETYQKALQVAKKTLESRALPAGRLSEAKKVVQKIMTELEGNSELCYTMSVIRSVDEYTFEHSVNVCLLSLVIGAALHYSRDDLQNLGVGALLHDLGKIHMPDLVRKQGSLTPGEWERMKEHTTLGFNDLRRHFDLSLLSAHVAYQHHERLDGSGYPRGLKGGEIHEFGLISAVADVFDAMNADRPYRPRREPQETAEELRRQAGKTLHPEMVKKLLERVALYPTASIVLLSSGEIGVVAGQTSDPARPRVRIVADADYRLVEPYDLDLRERPNLTVRRLLEDYPEKVRMQMAQLRASPVPISSDGSGVPR